MVLARAMQHGTRTGGTVPLTRRQNWAFVAFFAILDLAYGGDDPHCFALVWLVRGVQDDELTSKNCPLLFLPLRRNIFII